MPFVRLVVVAVLVAACGVTSRMPDVSGRTFLSTSVTEAGADRPLVPGTRIRLGFGSDGRLSGDAGCNSFSGPFRIAGGHLELRDAAMTAMGCDPARHAQDEWLTEFLGSGPSVALTDRELILESGGTAIRLVDREVVEPDQSLVGPVWAVTTALSGDVASSVPDDPRATLQFAADGTVAVNTGCNVGQGRIQGDATLVRVVDLGLTRRACMRDAARLEASVLEVLNAPSVSVSIDASTLTLHAGDSGLQLTAH